MKSEYEIYASNWEHVNHVAEHMREADRREVDALTGRTPKQALATAFGRSQCFTGVFDGEPVCLFGIQEPGLLHTVASPWMLATDKVFSRVVPFLRISREVINAFKFKHKFMENYVDARNHDAVSWLSWLGFTIAKAAPYGVHGLDFHRFYMVTSDV